MHSVFAQIKSTKTCTHEGHTTGHGLSCMRSVLYVRILSTSLNSLCAEHDGSAAASVLLVMYKLGF